jgi:CHASE2 domain-containing sensor protein
MRDSRDDPQAVTVFISYAHEDDALRQDLEKRLIGLERQGILRRWDDRRIAAGTDWERQINEQLDSAGLILLLVSPDFIASDYCNRVEVPRSMQRHVSGQARVIPILVRPTPGWESMPFGTLQSLPPNGRAVTKWRSRDDAFSSIVEGIREAVSGLARSGEPPPAGGETGRGEEQGPFTGPSVPPRARRGSPPKIARGVVLRHLALGLAAASLLLLCHWSGWLDRLELMALDARFRLAPAGDAASEVVLVVIDQESKDRLSPLKPFSRGKHIGEVINRLSDAGATAIGLDLLFADAAAATDDGELATALRDTPSAVLAIDLDVAPPSSGPPRRSWEVPPRWSLPVRPEQVLPAGRIVLPAKSVAHTAHGAGHVTLWADQDGVVRRVPALISYEGRVYPSLSLAVALRARGLEPGGVRLLDDGTLELASSNGPPLRVPLERDGSMPINFQRGAAQPGRIPLWQVLERFEPPELRSLFGGKVVIVGSALDGDSDVGPTPLHASIPLVEAHAQAAATILRQAFVLPAWAGTATVLVLGLALLVTAATWRLGPILGLAATAFILAAYVGLAFGVFCGPTRRVCPLVGPSLAGIVAYVFELIAQSRYDRKPTRNARPLQPSTKGRPHPTAS